MLAISDPDAMPIPMNKSPTKKRNAASSERPSRKAKGRKPSQKFAVTKKTIIDGAAALFAERGYGLTTLSGIAERIGIHVTGIYYYYDNKEQLAFDVISQSAEHIQSVMKAAFRSLRTRASALSRIETGIDVYLYCVLGPENLMRAAARITSQISPETRNQALERMRDQNRLWYQLIKDAIAEESIRSDLDPKLVQMILLGSMNWTVEWFDPKVGPIEPLARSLKAAFLEGLLPLARRRSPRGTGT
jgi:AcrR family transcriptional regulator